MALLPQRLREVLARAGITLDTVLPGWQEAGALQRSGDGRAAWLHSLRLDAGKARVYVFAPGVIELHDACRDGDDDA